MGTGPKVEQVVVPSLAVTIPAALVDQVVPALSKYLVYALTEKIKRDMTPSLAEELVQTIAMSVNAITPLVNCNQLLFFIVFVSALQKVALGVSTSLGHILTRSITHSLVASLTRTMAYAPLHESYCMFCYSQGKYCDYCQFNPQTASAVFTISDRSSIFR